MRSFEKNGKKKKYEKITRTKEREMSLITQKRQKKEVNILYTDLIEETKLTY